MSSNREQLKNAFAKIDNVDFSSLSSPDRERLITRLNTVGTKAETRQTFVSLRDAD